MAEPISTAEAKKHLRVDSTIDDALIADAIIAAREWVEDFTGLVLTQRVVTESVSALSSSIRLRAWPVTEDQAIELKYRDGAGADQSIAGAALRVRARPAIVFPPAWWRSLRIAGPIDIVFTAGFSNPADVPQLVKQALLVMLTAFYEDREGGELFARAERSARGLLRGKRRWSL